MIWLFILKQQNFCWRHIPIDTSLNCHWQSSSSIFSLCGWCCCIYILIYSFQLIFLHWNYCLPEGNSGCMSSLSICFRVYNNVKLSWTFFFLRNSKFILTIEQLQEQKQESSFHVQVSALHQRVSNHRI